MSEDNKAENKANLGKDEAQNAPKTEENKGVGTTAPKKDEANIVDNISNKLSEEGVKEVGKTNFNPKETIPFDPTKLTSAQIQTFKAMLEATPDKLSTEVAKPRITIRKHQGKYVIDFKRAYEKVMKDVELNKEVAKHIIPILYKGEKEYVEILYSEFINSERVVCEVLKHTQEKKKFVEGETISRATGRLTELLRTEMIHHFTIKLPDNEGELEIEGKMANA